MPIYSYKCECGNEENRILKIDDRDSQLCECGSLLMRQWVFEGSVWSPTKNGGHS